MFNVLPDDGYWRAATTSSKVARSPQNAFVIVAFRYIWAIAAQQSTRCTFKTVNQTRYCQFWRIVVQQVNMHQESAVATSTNISFNCHRPKYNSAYETTTRIHWLKEAPLQQSLKDLERADKNFFQKRAAFPRFKKRGQNDAFRYPQGVKLDQANSRISLPKLGWIRYRNSREVIGVVKNVTVSQSCGKMYVSIQTEYEVSDPQHKSTSMVGLDAGVAKFGTL